MPDWAINLIYFFLGLAVAVIGIIQNHYYYVKQQQDKFNQITNALDKIAERLAVLEIVMNEQRIEQLIKFSDTQNTQTDRLHITSREMQALKLIFGDGLNHQEAATQMGIQVDSLRSHIASLHAKGLTLPGRKLTALGQRILDEIHSENTDKQND